MSFTPDIRDDFYSFVNAEWISTHPIPPDKTSVNAFSELNDKAEEDLRTLVDEIVNNTGNEPGSLSRKIGDFYRTGMDTEVTEQRGITPLGEEFARIDSITTISDVQTILPYLALCGIDPLFGIFAHPDPKNSDLMIAGLSQGGLGLPTKEYYFRADPESARVRNEYKMHIRNMFGLLGDDQALAEISAERIMQIETQLADASFSPEENRDPIATYNKMDVTTFENKTPHLGWTLFLEGLGYPDIAELNVRQPRFFSGLDALMTDIPPADWKIFFRWKLIATTSHCLSHKFEEELFHFYGTVLSGQQQMRPRWKRVLGVLDGALGFALGKLYVETHFPEESRRSVIELVLNLKESFRRRITELSWMTPETKRAALDKLESMNLKIGYPDEWPDYSLLKVGSDSYVQNLIRAMNFNLLHGPFGLDKVGRPVDRSVWYMTPQTVNAYYSPEKNEIVFPAAILQPPFFSIDADPATNYGAIGSVIGHEMVHAFDDSGRKFDKSGNLRDWWTKTDEDEFSRRSQKIVDQFNKYEVFPGVFVNGNLALGENIADLGGVTVACLALAFSRNKRKPDGIIRKLRCDKEFFIGYARAWRENIRDETLRNNVLSDEHAPSRLRVNGVLSNIPAFYDAFPSIQPGDPMYREPEIRTDLW